MLVRIASVLVRLRLGLLLRKRIAIANYAMHFLYFFICILSVSLSVGDNFTIT